jgi:hypothetical protein
MGPMRREKDRYDFVFLTYSFKNRPMMGGAGIEN